MVKYLDIQGARVGQWAAALDRPVKQTRGHFEQGDIPEAVRGRRGRSNGTAGQWSADLNETTLAEAARRIDDAEMADMPAWMPDLMDLIGDGLSDAEIEKMLPPDAFENYWKVPLDKALAKARRALNGNAGGLSQSMKIALRHLPDEWKAQAKIPDGLVEAHVVGAAFRAAERGVEVTASKMQHMRNRFRECLAHPDFKKARRAMRRTDKMIHALCPHPRTMRVVMDGTNNGEDREALGKMACTAAQMLALVELRLSERGRGGKTTFMRKGVKNKVTRVRKPSVKVRRALPRKVEGIARKYWWMIVPPKPRQGYGGRPRLYHASLVAESGGLAVLRDRCASLNREAEKEMGVPAGSFLDEEDPEFFGWPPATAKQRRTAFYRQYDKAIRGAIYGQAVQNLNRPLSERRPDGVRLRPVEDAPTTWGGAEEAARSGIITDLPSFGEDGRPVAEV
jgi:hypothetical protein